MPTMFKGTGLYSGFLFLSFFSFYVEMQRVQLPEATCGKKKTKNKKRFIGPERCFWNSRYRDGRATWIPCGWGNVTRWPPYPHCLNPVRPANSLRHPDTPFSACFSFFVDYFCLDDLHINKTGLLNSPCLVKLHQLLVHIFVTAVSSWWIALFIAM